MGVVAVGVLALGVSALAAPRPVDDSAVRGTNKGKTEVTRLVTGDPAQIDAVVAGGPAGTAIIEIVPVLPPTGGDCTKPDADGNPNVICATGSNAGGSCTSAAQCPPSPAYPAGTTIVGNTLKTQNSNGFRVWLEVHISNWDPSGDNIPPLKVFQVKQDCIGDGATKGYMNDKGGAPLANPQIPCTLDEAGDISCQKAFGQNWAKCADYAGVPYCQPGYLDKSGTKHNSPSDIAKNWCTGGTGCDAGDVATAINCNYNYFAVFNATRKDNHVIYYAGTEIIDIPGKNPGPAAKGLYCVNLLTDETFLADTSAPPIDIPTASETGFCIDIQQGSCCHNLGDPILGGCTNDMLKNECDAAALQPSLWKAEKDGGTCLNPPTADGCAQCTLTGRNTDPLCKEQPTDDLCTDDDCLFPPGICSHHSISGFDPNKDGGIGPIGTSCCNPATAALSTKDDADACTCDSCSLANNRGVALHIPCPNPCDDLNACTTADTCDGVRTEAGGGCHGTDINTLDCVTDADCPAGTTCGTALAGKCFCTLIPNVQFLLSPSNPKLCDGGFRDGLACSSDADCTGGGVCNNFANGANCFDQGEKISAVVHIGSAGDPVNGGELLMTYDPTCVKYNSAVCLAPYTTTVYGPIVNAAAGTIFIACGVDPFGGINGPLGNTNMVSLSFTKNGACDNCELCFADNNPLHSYLVNDEGQAVNIEGKCKELSGKGDLVLDVPDSIKTNVDCDKPTAVVTWAPPTATFECGAVSLSCRGVREDGSPATSLAMGGGLFAQGATSFCCYAVGQDKCGTAAGCPGAANDCATGANGKPVGCWTVQVNDETSMDIDIGLEPPMASGTLTRCIEFCLYANCTEAPLCFQDDVTFGGIYNFIGKSQGKIKIPGKGQWDCITAQDQLHSLRSSCKSQGGCLHCDGSQLVADFTGDPELGGNWLIGGNLDAYKKDVPKASHNIIDILDFGMFVSQFGVCYADPAPGCHDGPNADINGDGCVTAADYNFIIRNFLVSSKNACCLGDAASTPTPLAEVSVDQLRQMGMGELVVADLNGDGLVNAQDMDAFMQGARPTKTSNDRKGGKGLRSGR
jgi:hypothetical protein